MRKSILTVIGACIFTFATAGMSHAQNSVHAKKTNAKNPYLGAWQLDYVKSVFPDGRVDVKEDEGMELKLFSPTHFTYIQRDANHAFSGTGGGPYTYADGALTLTHAFQAVEKWAGYTATWNVKLEDDTFVLSGFKKIVDSQGKDVTKEVVVEIGQPEQRYRRIQANESHQKESMQTTNPLVSAWMLTHRTAVYPDGRKEVRDNEDIQIKLFTPSHFTYIMRSADGELISAGGGPYVYEGDSFKETHAFQSVPEWVDYTAWWDVQFGKDAFYMTGPTKVVNGQGVDVTEDVIAGIGRVEEIFERLDLASGKNESYPVNTLVGSWDYVSHRFVLPDTVLQQGPIPSFQGRYVISESNFSFVHWKDDGELLNAGIGTYTFDGNRFTEHVEFHTAPRHIGTSIEFQIEVVGDTLKKMGMLSVPAEWKSFAGDATEVALEEIRVRVK